MKAITLSAFVLMAIVQWYVPLSMVSNSEATLSDGEELRFRTRPVDPSDPFRGKYVTLSFDEETQRLDTVPQYLPRQQVYVSLAIDTAGFADVVDVYTDDPGDELPWIITAQVAGSYNIDSVQVVTLEFPFNRFYMEESKASDAEKAYWESMLVGAELKSYAVVRVKSGHAVLTDLRIGDRSIVDIVKEMNTKVE